MSGAIFGENKSSLRNKLYNHNWSKYNNESKRYYVRTIKRPFGEGIEIYWQGYNEQIKCKKGLIARIFPTEETSKGLGDSYMSVIYKYPFKHNRENHSLFKELTDRLNEKQDKIINNGPLPFKIYTDQGLEKKLGNGTVIRINKEDKKGFPKEAYQFVDSWGHLVGYSFDAVELITGLGLTTLGIGSFVCDFSTFKYALPTAAGGIALLLDVQQSGEWRGRCEKNPGFAHRLGHKIGIKLATSNFEERLRKEDYALKKFLLSNNHVDELRFGDPPLNEGNSYCQKSKHRNDVYEALKKMFEFTPYQKGFSITSKHKDKANALKFLDYILTDKKEAPQLSPV